MNRPLSPVDPPNQRTWQAEAELQSKRLAMRDERLANRMSELYECTRTMTYLPPVALITANLNRVANSLEDWNNSITSYEAEFQHIQSLISHNYAAEEGPHQEVILVSQLRASHVHILQLGRSFFTEYNLLFNLMESMTLTGRLQELDRLEIVHAIQTGMGKHPLGGHHPIVYEMNMRTCGNIRRMENLVEIERTTEEDTMDHLRMKREELTRNNNRLQENVDDSRNKLKTSTDLIMSTLQSIAETNKQQAEQTRILLLGSSAAAISADLRGVQECVQQQSSTNDEIWKIIKDLQQRRRGVNRPEAPLLELNNWNRNENSGSSHSLLLTRTETNNSSTRYAEAEEIDSEGIVRGAQQEVDRLHLEIHKRNDGISRGKVRRFTEGGLRGRDERIPCVFCRARGEHYSDLCARIRSAQERRNILRTENRCHLCLEKYCKSTITCSKRNQKCFYCTEKGHHCSICDIPEQILHEEEELHSLRRELEHAEEQLREARSNLHSEGNRDGKRRRL